MTEIIYQIPGFEKGSVQYVYAADDEAALFLTAQMASDILNKWNTNTAVFSLTCRSCGLRKTVKNESIIAKFYTINQKNHKLDVILRKARGLVNRRFVRVVFIEGFQKQDTVGKRWLEQFAKLANIPIVAIQWNNNEKIF